MASETLVPFATSTEAVAILKIRTSGGTVALEISRRPGEVANLVVQAVLLETDLCLVTRNGTMLLLSRKGMY